MTIRKSLGLLACLLVALPAVDAVAQSTAGTASLSPGPLNANGDPVAASKNIPADDNPRVPGATGDTIVKGDQSTVAGDRAATVEQRTNFK
jgi:hypothetical protein